MHGIVLVPMLRSAPPRPSALTLVPPLEPPVAARSPGRALQSRAVLAGAAVLAALYLLHLGTPLRLSTDTHIYLQSAAAMAEGEGYQARGYPGWAIFPVGFPAAVAVLDGVGLGTTEGLFALNLFSAGAGLWAWYLMLRLVLGCSAGAAGGLSLLTAASYGLVKHTVLVLSDVPFFGLASVALLALARYRAAPGTARLVTALVLVTASLLVRSAAVAFVPVVAWVLVERMDLRGLGGRLRRRPVLAFTAVVASLAIALPLAYLLGASRYVGDLYEIYGGAEGGAALWWSLQATLTNLGELAVNVPRTMLRGMLPPAGPRMVMYASGLAWVVLGVAGAVGSRARTSVPALFAYSYLGLLLVWPSDDVRFFLPVLPLLLAAVYRGGERLFAPLGARALRVLGGAYAAAYLVLGLAALGYSLSIAYAGADAFGARYGGGTYRVPYDACLLGVYPADADQTGHLDEESRYGGYWLLHRYEGCAALRCEAGVPAPTPPPSAYHRTPPCVR